MTMFAKTFALACALMLWGQAQQNLHAAEPAVTVTTPARDGISVSCQSDVAGTVTELNPDQHVWILTARSNFAKLGLYWPQGEAEVDPTTHKFSLSSVVYGQAHDVGSTFRIAVVVVDDQTHARLQADFVKAISSGRFNPIQLPPTATDPKYRDVRKISHDGCSN
jgi:hypothetical protein